MDGDGEDRPEEIKSLIEKGRNNQMITCQNWMVFSHISSFSFDHAG